MLTAEQRRVVVFTGRLRLNHAGLILSIMNFLCKIIVTVGMLITIFSNRWARSLNKPYRYTGYKTRCTVHVCILSDSDPTWLVDIMCLLSIINLLIELMNILIIGCHSRRPRKIDILLGLMFIFTFIIADCGIFFGIYMAAYTYQLPMGYAYYCFVCGLIFSIVDWGISLKRCVSDWPEMIFLTPDPLTLYTNRSETMPAQMTTTSPDIVAYDDINF